MAEEASAESKSSGETIGAYQNRALRKLVPHYQVDAHRWTRFAQQLIHRSETQPIRIQPKPTRSVSLRPRVGLRDRALLTPTLLFLHALSVEHTSSNIRLYIPVSRFIVASDISYSGSQTPTMPMADCSPSLTLRLWGHHVNGKPVVLQPTSASTVDLVPVTPPSPLRRVNDPVT